MAYCHWLSEQLRTLAHERLATENPLSESERRFWQGLADGSLGVGLPSEAEWEKAARGTGGWIYPWGKVTRPPERANYHDTGLDATTTVGCFLRRRQPLWLRGNELVTSGNGRAVCVRTILSAGNSA